MRASCKARRFGRRSRRTTLRTPVASIVVANLIGQHGVATRATKTAPVRYDAIRTGLSKVAEHARLLGASVHMPRIGCGLAGGNWATIEPIIDETLVTSDVAVTVYDFASA